MRALLAACALVLASHPFRTVLGEGEWAEVRSPHFQVVGNAGRATARRTAQRLEMFRSALDPIFPGQRQDDPAPTRVLLFKDAGSLAALFPVHGGKRVPIGGLFVRGIDRDYMALNVRADAESQRTVFHEYTHLLASRLPAPLPLWMNEGLAELYSTAEVQQREVVIGKPPAGHVRTLKERPLLPLETLFAVDQRSPYYNEHGEQQIFYAQSWALVHYLLVHETGRGHAFLDALAAGASSAEASRRSLGKDPGALLRTLNAHVRRYSFTYRKAPVPGVAPGALSEAAVAPHEAAFYVGDCLVHLDRLDDARPFLEKAIGLEPAFAPAYRSMGMGYHLTKDYAGARRWLDGAIERDPSDAMARFLRARAAIQAAGPSFGPAAAATVRDDLRIAVTALPRLRDAWLLLAHADSVLGRRDDEAVAVLREALRLAPERSDLWRRLVHVHVARREIAEARRLAGLLRARAQTAEERQTADRLLELVAGALQAPPGP